jgi:hypothetical protein
MRRRPTPNTLATPVPSNTKLVGSGTVEIVALNEPGKMLFAVGGAKKSFCVPLPKLTVKLRPPMLWD